MSACTRAPSSSGASAPTRAGGAAARWDRHLVSPDRLCAEALRASGRCRAQGRPRFPGGTFAASVRQGRARLERPAQEALRALLSHLVHEAVQAVEPVQLHQVGHQRAPPPALAPPPPSCTPLLQLARAAHPGAVQPRARRGPKAGASSQPPSNLEDLMQRTCPCSMSVLRAQPACRSCAAGRRPCAAPRAKPTRRRQRSGARGGRGRASAVAAPPARLVVPLGGRRGRARRVGGGVDAVEAHLAHQVAGGLELLLRLACAAARRRRIEGVLRARAPAGGAVRASRARGPASPRWAARARGMRAPRHAAGAPWRGRGRGRGGGRAGGLASAPGAPRRVGRWRRRRHALRACPDS